VIVAKVSKKQQKIDTLMESLGEMMARAEAYTEQLDNPLLSSEQRANVELALATVKMHAREDMARVRKLQGR